MENEILALVCSDPGGAEILSDLALNLKQMPPCCLSGAAVGIFKKKFDKYEEIEIDKLATLKQSEGIVLTATSLVSDHERIAISYCRANGMRSASFIDHWVNYKIRFGNEDNWLSRLPDEIWVGDGYAKQLALKEGFPEERIKLVPNPHFIEIEKRIKRQGVKSNDSSTTLILCEPISLLAELYRGHSDGYGFTETTWLEDLLSSYLAKGHKGLIRVRPHPKEDRNKYDRIIDKYSSQIRIQKSTEPDFLADILDSANVLAIESMGLVIALLAGKQAISYIPGSEYECHLPHREIRHINSIEQLKDIL